MDLRNRESSSDGAKQWIQALANALSSLSTPPVRRYLKSPLAHLLLFIEKNETSVLGVLKKRGVLISFSNTDNEQGLTHF